MRPGKQAGTKIAMERGAMREAMRASRFWTQLAVAAGLSLLPPAPSVLTAQELEEDETGGEYSRALVVEGDVRLVRAYDGESAPLQTNVPVVAGDRIEAEPDSRLEIQFPDGSFLRAAGPARLDIHSLADPWGEADTLTHLSLGSGDLSLDLSGSSSEDERSFQVDTPSCTLFPMTRGLVRVRVGTDGRAGIWVREGVVEVGGAGRTHLLRSGQSTECKTGEPPSRPGTALARLDDFERWVDERRGEIGATAADEEIVEDLPEAVQPYAAELSYYGRWETVPTYGLVWIPSSLPSSWYPYYYGYWLGSPSGYAWVSYEPWGWAPYHYGRWNWSVGIGWVWIPGGVYSGAWVHWYPGSAHVAWVPLGWHDVPAINVGILYSRGYRYPSGGWACVPYSHFYSRDLPRRYMRNPEHYRQHLRQSVPVRHLPRFRPQDARSRPEMVASQVMERARRDAQEPAPKRFHAAQQRERPGVAARTPVIRTRPAVAHGDARVTRPVIGPSAGPSARPRATAVRPTPPRSSRRAAPAPPATIDRRQTPKRTQEARGRDSGADSSIKELLQRLSRPAPAPPVRSREVVQRPNAQPRPGADRPQRGRAPERNSGPASRQSTPKGNPRGPNRP
jgi:hypothetical protein